MTGNRLQEKVAIVTGGGSGIGRAICLRFAAEGARVAALDFDQPGGEETVKLVESASGAAAFFPCDISQQKLVRETFDAVVKRFGQLDVLVNNAGVAHIGTVETTTEEDFDRVFRVNIKGAYNCLQAGVAHLKARGGAILNICSVAATMGIPDRFAYSMSKGAVYTMTLSVACDCLKYNIRCNCISPARVHTPFVDGYLKKNYPGREKEMFEKLSKTQPIGRMGQPDEIASLALFLCSDEAAFITGCDYLIDGGFEHLKP